MRLSGTAFNAFLAHIGQRYDWRQSHVCPCVNPSSGAPKKTCQQCGGKGHIWAAPVAGVAGVAGQKVQREWAQFGRWESGDVVLTIPSDSPLYAAREFDRLTLLNATHGFSINLVRGDGDVLMWPILEIERVFWLDGAGAIVEGGIPTVSADGLLTWVADEPPVGQMYSITGSRYGEYFVYTELPANRNMHSGEPLPRRVVARKLDLLTR